MDFSNDSFKICGVCGDKALGYNFNALTCESCKAFFRRNALRNKKFSCISGSKCLLDPKTRKYCRKCRLDRCFEIGMKKEWILTDEEKILKRRKHRHITEFNDADSSTANTMIYQQVLADSKSTPKSQLPTSTNNIIILPIIPSKINRDQEISDKDNDEQWNRKTDISEELFKKLDRKRLIEFINEQLNLELKFSQSSSFSSEKQNDIIFCNDFDPLTKTSKEMVQDNQPIDMFDQQTTSSKFNNLGMEQNFDPSQQSTFFNQEQFCLSNSMNNSIHDSYGLMKNSTMVGDKFAGKPDLLNFNHQTSPPPTIFDMDSQDLTNTAKPSPSTSNIPKSKLDTKTEDTKCNKNSDGDGWLNNISRSVYEHAIRIEYLTEHLRTPECRNGSKTLSRIEMDRLNELKRTFQPLYSSEIGDNDSAQNQRKVITTIQEGFECLESTIRQLILVIKGIRTFKNLCSHDQLALMKGSISKVKGLLNILRYFNPKQDVITFPSPQTKNTLVVIEPGCMRKCWGDRIYDRCKKFALSFRDDWRDDHLIMNLLIMIIVFLPNRPEILHREYITLEYLSYCYLLQRYLEYKYNSICEAKSVYINLLSRVEELNYFTEECIEEMIMKFNPKYIGPLTSEIYDLNKKLKINS